MPNDYTPNWADPDNWQNAGETAEDKAVLLRKREKNATYRQRDAKEEQSSRASSLRGKQKNLRNLQAARSANPAEADRQKMVEHVRNQGQGNINDAMGRAKITASELAPLSEVKDPALQSSRVAGVAAGHENASKSLGKFGFSREESVGETAYFRDRPHGAVTPPPHPKSLSERAKYSPKAGRDAWRASQPTTTDEGRMKPSDRPVTDPGRNKADLTRMRHDMKSWASREKTDIESGVKQPPASSLDNFMAEKGVAKDLGEKEPGATKAQGLRGRAIARAQLNKADSTKGSDAGKYVPKGTPKISPDRSVKIPQAESRVTDVSVDDFDQAGQSKYPIGQGQKDLGRSMVRAIRAEKDAPLGQLTTGDGALARLAKKRLSAGKSIAGVPGNLDAESRQSFSNSLKAAGSKLGKLGKVAGKAGGALGMYGIIKGVVEGAETLRKLKTGAYGVSPEGTAVPRKGIVES